ncbi:MAG: hypothetical protein D6690_10090 [Nitrospirae bacterium]|nr:MAG: hypothetical protein D6690_10090 [Nitrospirota bacterium]
MKKLTVLTMAIVRRESLLNTRGGHSTEKSVRIGALGVARVVAKEVAHVVEEFEGVNAWRGRHTIPPWWCPEMTENKHRENGP